MKKYLMLLLVLSVAVACADLVGPSRDSIEFVNQRPYQTADAWRMSYAQAELRPTWVALEACSGLKGDFDSVRFYTATGIMVGGVRQQGIWQGGENSVTVLTGSYVWQVQHEMMHALLQSGEHPVAYFNGKCGNLLTGGA